MAGYCTSVWPYFHEPQASENTAQDYRIWENISHVALWEILLAHILGT